MKAEELEVEQWFHWIDDWRMFKRLSGEAKIIEGIRCVSVKPLQPTTRQTGFYIPANELVKLYKLNFFRLI